MDVVALMALIILPLSGVITLEKALAGFSDPNVILIAALFVIGDGLVRTGITYRTGNWLIKKSGKSETRLIMLLMLAVSGLGAFMSSTGVVAMFIPVAMSVARRLKIAPARLMMPIGFAGLISGMLTLVATSSNMVIDSALRREGLAGFSFFSFTPIGSLILLLGIGYMLALRRWLRGADDDGAGTSDRRGLAHFIEAYHLQQRSWRLRIGEDSPMKGKRLEDLNLRRRHGVNVLAVERSSRFRDELLNPAARMELHVGDVLLVDFFEKTACESFHESMKLRTLPLRSFYFMEHLHEVGMAEVIVPPESSLIGKTVVELAFRSHHGLNVVGLRRNGKAYDGSVPEVKLTMGDILLVVGPWKAIRHLQGQGRDFVVLDLPVEVDEVAPALHRAPHALLSLVFMVGLMVSGLVPNVIAALTSCLLMGFFRCVSIDSAYKSIQWQTLILIAGMMPFAYALQSTGGVDLAVEVLVGVVDGTGSRMLLASLFVLTAIIGLFISNTVTAVLMAPIAMGMAQHLDVSPLPFAMTVAVAASSAFMTPISSPVNALVMGSGRYRFSDFVKIGVPFTILVMLVTVLVIPWLFPF